MKKEYISPIIEKVDFTFEAILANSMTDSLESNLGGDVSGVGRPFSYGANDTGEDSGNIY